MTDLPKPIFQLFGGLWLEDPRNYLNEQAISGLDGLTPLFREIEQRWMQRKHTPCSPEADTWNLQNAFETFTRKETEEWKKYGVTRPHHFLVPPGGQEDADIASHTHNPTWHCSDPLKPVMIDTSNPTINQITQVGFTSDNCFFFDHIARRGETPDCIKFYPDSVREIHEDYMLELRRHMKAVIEVCWGAHVRKRMQACLQLVPLRLWGDFKDIELFLELRDEDSGRRLVRFIIFVDHPQKFFKASTLTERGRKWRALHGKRQDLHLTVTAKLGGILIKEAFYELHHHPGEYGRINAEQTIIKTQLREEALAELKTAVPEVFEESEKRKRKPMISELHEGLTDAPDISLMIEKLSADEYIPIFDDKGQSYRSDIIKANKDLRTVAQAIKNGYLDGSIGLSDINQITEFEYLPKALIEWLQSQNGLKTRGKPIETYHELLTAYQLLRRCGTIEHTGSTLDLALAVAFTDAYNIGRSRKSSVLDLMVLASTPQRQVMTRKCSKCGEHVLDDGFAYHAKNNPQYYVKQTSETGCGNRGCAGRVSLVPFDDKQQFCASLWKNLKDTPGKTEADWAQYIVRTETESKNLPTPIGIRCRRCEKGYQEDPSPRWTIEKIPRYLRPHRWCAICEFPTYWEPKDQRIRTIDTTTIRKTWKMLQDAGCDLRNCPRLPELFFSNQTDKTKIEAFKEAKRSKQHSS